jgi:hypothetical protein
MPKIAPSLEFIMLYLILSLPKYKNGAYQYAFGDQIHNESDHH